ncbi:MAG: 3'-5' exonuclease [Bacteroidales bacterium]|nr:3'-5' exonuclease [Bacteroidales bacterium]
MELNLKNPLVFFDLETTGINIVTDRIVEISYLKVYPDGHEESHTYRVNPGMPIPKEASDVHHITDEDVKDCPTFREIGKVIANDIKGCDLAGFNSNRFDIPLLAEEFLRNDIDIDLSTRKMIDVQVIFHRMEQRTLTAAYKFYCHKDLVGAHGAEADTKATYEVLKAQLDRYPDDLENDIAKLAEFSHQTRNVDFAGKIVYNANGVEVFNFGKYKDMPVEEVLKKDTGYYGWMMNGDFPLNTKKVLTNIRLRQQQTLF